MEYNILAPISSIRDCKRKPSKEEIQQWVQNNSNYIDNSFEETLFYAGKIYTKNGKDLYCINDAVNIVETQDNAKLKNCLAENDDQDLIIMLKNIMLKN